MHRRRCLVALAALALAAGCSDDSGVEPMTDEELREAAERYSEALGREVRVEDLVEVRSPSGDSSAVVLRSELAGGHVCWRGDELLDSPEVRIAHPGTTTCLDE